MKTSLRPFTPEDVPLLQSWIDAGDASRFMSRWRPRSFSGGGWPDGLVRWHMILSGDQEIGTIWIERDSEDEHAGDLGILIADPAFRGRGIGSEAIRLAESDAKAAWGIGVVRLRVRASNLRGIACYRKSGYEVTGDSQKEIDGEPTMIFHMEHRF